MYRMWLYRTVAVLHCDTVQYQTAPHHSTVPYHIVHIVPYHTLDHTTQYMLYHTILYHIVQYILYHIILYILYHIVQYILYHITQYMRYHIMQYNCTGNHLVYRYPPLTPLHSPPFALPNLYLCY